MIRPRRLRNIPLEYSASDASHSRPPRSDRGSAAVELAIAAPVLAMFILVAIFGGRVAVSHQAVQSAASDAARAASLSRSGSEAKSEAIATVNSTMNSQALNCARVDVDVDTSGFSRPPGQAAKVTVSVECQVSVADLGLPSVGVVKVSATMSSALDTYRERRP